MKKPLPGFINRAKEYYRGAVTATAICLSLVTTGQATYTVIGSGTTFNTTTGYPAPYGNYYYGAKHQFLVTAAELSAAGITPANIQSIGFNVGTSNNVSHLGWTINIYTTTVANPLVGGFINTGIVSTSTVMNYMPTTGWNQHAVAPFNWYGTENIVIETCFNNTSFVTNALTMWTTTLSGATFSRWRNADAAGQCTMNAVSASTNTRPNIRFGWEPLPPCAGSPPSNAVVSPTFELCPGQSIKLNLANPTNSTGLTFQWYYNTQSGTGPYSVVPTGGTESSFTTPTLNTTTYYQVDIGCIGQGTTTSLSGTVMIAGTTTNTVPYYEGFEGIGLPNRLPNCSWWAPQLGGSFQTYVASNSGNRVPRNGTSFAAYSAPTLNNLVHSNGIYMQPGITYSAAVHFATEYTGANNWTNFALLLGTDQTGTNTVMLAQEAPAISGAYKRLSTTFTVPNPGLYYLTFRASGGGAGAPYLMMDDISVTIPCTPASGNTPTISLMSNSSVACLGQPFNITANGADVYNWSDNSTGQVVTVTPGQLGTNTFVAAGTRTLTGCTGTASILLNVQAPPVINVTANPPAVCQGKSSLLIASGANTYAWNIGGNGPQTLVTPATSGSYMVIGTSTNNCTSSANVSVTVYSLPDVNAGATRTLICRGESSTLTATGASGYVWMMLNSSNLLQGGQVIINPLASDTYTVTGTDGNGCQNTDVVTIGVDECAGVAGNTLSQILRVYPNPGSGLFVVEMKSGSQAQLEVLDLTGRVLLTKQATEKKTVFDISGFAAGIYTLKATGEGRAEVVKIIKN